MQREQETRPLALDDGYLSYLRQRVDIRLPPEYLFGEWAHLDLEERSCAINSNQLLLDLLKKKSLEASRPIKTQTREDQQGPQCRQREPTEQQLIGSRFGPDQDSQSESVQDFSFLFWIAMLVTGF